MSGNSVKPYADFLQNKRIAAVPTGKKVAKEQLHPTLFDFQQDIVLWALHKGRAAIFADTGLGKTFMQLEWARLTGEKTLIIAPLSVARQTVREAIKIDIELDYVRQQAEVVGSLSITNYEMIDNFDLGQFGAVVLDESSILKAIGGKTRKRLTEICAKVPYRLCCTATPAPNDYTELGNHVEFLGICKASEMLAMFFINANKEHTYYNNGTAYRKKGTNKGGTEWRLKHHAEEPFFRWMATWAMALMRPSDLGYPDEGFNLPALNIHTEFVPVQYQSDDQLFFTHIKGIKDASKIRGDTAPVRAERLGELINGQNEQWIVWCGLNQESSLITKTLPGAIEVKGDDSPDAKAKAFEDFQDGNIRILVTKPTIGGFGMNFQNAHKMVFFGLNYSWEQFYQCIRRQWRYGQTEAVDAYIIMSDLEESIYQNIMRKGAQAKRLQEKLIASIQDKAKGELYMETTNGNKHYEETEKIGDGWQAMMGDSCQRLGDIPADSIDLSVYSPPFADLYTYTDSERDLGNSRNWNEFFRHYQFIISEVLRVTKQGRISAVHTSDIPAMAQKDGYIGIKDFPGEVLRAHIEAGWIFVGRAFIQKNPQAQAIRTKSKALLFVQMAKDSISSRPALVDQILIFRKPGDNAVPVSPTENGELDNEKWIEWAHGIWTGISETNTLQYGPARAADDEKHICPLQLETIERCVTLWSNPGETVLSPFMGIGSEGYESLRLGREFIGIELKESYFKIACQNLEQGARLGHCEDMFAAVGILVS